MSSQPQIIARLELASAPRLELALAGAGLLAAVVAAVWLLRRFRRPTPEAVERARRLYLNRVGRIAGGEILDAMPTLIAGQEAPGLPPALVYQYQVSGVVYEASQALHLVDRELDPSSWIPGWPVQVKFDPAQPANSIVVCEQWSGLIVSTRARAASAMAKSGSAPQGTVD